MPEVIEVRIHPPTAGAGVLCIDGGGARGVVPLKIMERIQDRIGLPMPFQKFFKAAFGVSSGGLIILALFIKGWSIPESTEAFKRLAEVAFQKRNVLRLPLLSRLQRYLISYLSDSIYPAENIELVLKEVFGIETNILDYSHATSIGTRIGLPVASVSNPPGHHVFTNYNGAGERDKRLDKTLKPKDGHGQVPIWEIARSISAAPGFFPPKHIKEVGTFQDSGPLENDPIQTAFSEVKALFPLIRQPDFLVSLGTGGSRSEASNISTDALSWTWRMRTVPRLWRMFEEKMRDRTIKDAFLSHPKYHRLDLELEDSEPRLDDVGSISELQTKAQEDESLSTVIDNVARCAIASLFYFEFDSTPKKLDNTFTASGRILCVLQPNDPSFRVLFAKLANDSSGFYIDNQPISGRLDDQSIFGLDGSFRLLVELRLNEKIAIYLKQPGSNPCNISGSPFSVNNVISAQGLDAFFGRSDHRKRKRLADTHITPRKKR